MKNFSFAIFPGDDLGVATEGSEGTTIGPVVGERISFIISADIVLLLMSGWTDAEAGDAAVLLPRRSRQTNLTPRNLESWNLVIAAAHVSTVR